MRSTQLRGLSQQSQSQNCPFVPHPLLLVFIAFGTTSTYFKVWRLSGGVLLRSLPSQSHWVLSVVFSSHLNQVSCITSHWILSDVFSSRLNQVSSITSQNHWVLSDVSCSRLNQVSSTTSQTDWSSVMSPAPASTR